MPKLTVVVSQSPGKNPAKRRLEEEIAAALLFDPAVDVSLVPHLYDLAADHPGLLFLRGVSGPLIVLGWLYPRATRWTLDRQGVRGGEGRTLLVSEDEEEDAEDAPPSPAALDRGPVPKRKVWCLDLRCATDPAVFLEEIGRIAAELAVPTVSLSLGGMNGGGKRLEANRTRLAMTSDTAPAALPVVGPEPKRRWYPVIDYSRCTNCMECIDFCLFGVYGVDNAGGILVEQQDSCKKGCPACSRVCPANAIVFPMHKTPTIAGASGEVESLKIDLSKLFGGEVDPLSLAVAERDSELVKDGRDAVGAAVGVPARQPVACGPRDDLDELMDGLDGLEL